jgi:hypothetical protein
MCVVLAHYKYLQDAGFTQSPCDLTLWLGLLELVKLRFRLRKN